MLHGRWEKKRDVGLNVLFPSQEKALADELVEFEELIQHWISQWKDAVTGHTANVSNTGYGVRCYRFISRSEHFHTLSNHSEVQKGGTKLSIVIVFCKNELW